jgi:hypothetical protein
LPKLIHRGSDAAGRFEEDEGESRGGGAGDEAAAFGLSAREETEEGEWARDESRGGNGGGKRGWSGDGRDRVAGGERGSNKRLTGVGDGGSAGVADEGDVARGKCFEEAVAAGTFVEGVVAEEWSLDAEMGEQAAGVSGILGGDQGDLAEDAQGAGGDVLQVADRGGDDVEVAHASSAIRVGERMIERVYSVYGQLLCVLSESARVAEAPIA